MSGPTRPPDLERPNRVVAYVPDLMDRSRLARLGSVTVLYVPDLVTLVAEAQADDLVVVDLSKPGVVEVLAQVSGRVVGFASHVDAALIEEARAAGCGEVLPRSRFFSTLGARFGAAGGTSSNE